MFLTFLTIICVRAMLAVVVLFDKQRIHGQVGVDREGYKSHLGALLHNFRIIHGVVRRGSP